MPSHSFDCTHPCCAVSRCLPIAACHSVEPLDGSASAIGISVLKLEADGVPDCPPHARRDGAIRSSKPLQKCQTLPSRMAFPRPDRVPRAEVTRVRGEALIAAGRLQLQLCLQSLEPKPSQHARNRTRLRLHMPTAHTKRFRIHRLPRPSCILVPVVGNP
ncbi:hypothetical protein BU16DRAFT_379177 [Lophium mytilinum]|uniref:Uncharacterized protein n=1 Tax=Lophium mytilinum TaxID=390894 RepID=A0A6A6QRQ1_9PEZI|nr:hypothetical protein BU16DRAFT_379177 [Lophium mytilinum]